MTSDIYRETSEESSARFRRWRSVLYGEPIVEPEVWGPDRSDVALTSELTRRVRQDKDAVVLVWGTPGSGKSTWVLDRARKVDPTFTPTTLRERVAFYTDEVPVLYERTPRYGAAWIDEAASVGLLSTEPAFSPRQRYLVELINLIRAKNVILFVVIPSPDDLAKSFRVRRADYRVECQERVEGEPVRAFWGRRVSQRHYFLTDSRWLGFSDEEHGVPLTWPDFRTSPDPATRAYWDAYWPLKSAFMDDRVSSIGKTLTRLRRKEERSNDGEDE